MRIIDIVKSLLPKGTDGSAFQIVDKEWVPATYNVDLCPIWPPDIFAIAGLLIERSGCYTLAGPTRIDPQSHTVYLSEIAKVVEAWAGHPRGLFFVPEDIQRRWTNVVNRHGTLDITEICSTPGLVDDLIFLFCAADEACIGMGWDAQVGKSYFSDLALASFVNHATIPKGVPQLPYSPNSVCALVPPSAAIVMPKTLTATVGCTIRSLSHHLALLPGISQCAPTWTLTNEQETGASYKPIRLLIVPFPFKIPADSFSITEDPVHLKDGTFSAAYFGLEPKWLLHKGKELTAKALFDELLHPLLAQALSVDSAPVTGIILPECALSETLATKLASLLGRSGASFFTTGVISRDRSSGKTRNVAKTFVLHQKATPHVLEQFKHHRWRLDRNQCDAYGLDFHWLSIAHKWWEDIDVSNRQLPFFAIRKYMSMTVLICEDLARNDPAMSVVRAVGPNLVIALLMDGPQLNGRWPGKYATVLGEDPGSGVLSVTCAGMMDRSNAHWDGPKRRVIGLWRSEDSTSREIELPDGHHAVVLRINSRKIEQHTLDTRTDHFGSRKLSLGKTTPLKLRHTPAWLC